MRRCAMRRRPHWPNEPLMLIPAMAAVTEITSAFGVTKLPSSLRAALPVRAADVDARSSDQWPGRPERGDRLFDRGGAVPARTSRPRMMTTATSFADEGMELVYKLCWEGSWEDDAAIPRPSRAALLPILRRCSRVAARRRQLPAQRAQSISPSRRRSARRKRFSTRPADRRAAGNSPPSTPNAYSCRDRRAKVIGFSRVAAIRGARRARRAATRPKS